MLENRYPNCAYDIPSHAYIYNFALNVSAPYLAIDYYLPSPLMKFRLTHFGQPEWPNFYSYSPDIWTYLDREDAGEWRVTLMQTLPDDTEKAFEERCHVLNGAGFLNNYKSPELGGIDKFKGRIVHTAVWPKGYQPEQWKNDRVAVIGSGASSIQTVPGMQPYIEHGYFRPAVSLR
ncbi:MoxY protein [Uncinocarpus reesii 1704]|uniref:MoxY protein n=1 Tax=Uncinocarpus reesii (strain UAMH 1704) TaxID=336963 RepID=C4JL84_UNCRE|nr:MoxY protein [Uncinocarpus reesii 1704]EEP78746.1 MoxY protein [Uncinocarpus reesii 1704]